MVRLNKCPSGAVVALIATFVFGAVSSAQRTSPSDESGMSCVERLEMPQYPALAARARIQGDVKAIIRLEAGGSVQAVTFEIPADHSEAVLAMAFYREVERAMRASKFSPPCGGRSILRPSNFDYWETSKMITEDWRSDILIISKSPRHNLL
jgi:hypothetical protein